MDVIIIVVEKEEKEQSPAPDYTHDPEEIYFYK